MTTSQQSADMEKRTGTYADAIAKQAALRKALTELYDEYRQKCAALIHDD